MDSGWTIKAGKPIPKWKIGPRIWRVDGNWRLKLYRPWSHKKQIEVTCKSFTLALYILGVGAGWWKDVVWGETPKTKAMDENSGQGLEETQEED